VTEAEWLKCSDPNPMLYHLRHQRKSRKRRLFAVACCRRIWRHLRDIRVRHAVDVAEKFVDGMATADELTAAHREAAQAALEANGAIMEFPVNRRETPWKKWKACAAAVHSVAPTGTANAAADALDASFC
jgi:hypothetical protein